MATNCSCGIKQQKLQYHCGGQIEAISAITSEEVQAINALDIGKRRA
jgi:hypothetical protein